MKKCENCGAVTLDSMTVCLECGTVFEGMAEKKAPINHQEEEQLDFDQLEFVEAEVLAPSKNFKATTPIVPEVPVTPVAPPEPMSELDMEEEVEEESSEIWETESDLEKEVSPETEQSTTPEPFIPPIARASSENLMREVFNPEPQYIAPNTFGPDENKQGEDVIEEILSTVNCPHCGNENPSYYSFCHFCKHRLHDYTTEEQLGNRPIDAEAVREEAILAAKSTHQDSVPKVEATAHQETDEFVFSHVEVQAPQVVKKKSHRPKKSKPKKESSIFKWVVRLLIAAIVIALAVFAFLYLRTNNSAEAVYSNYRQAMINNDYAKAAELTANYTGPTWQASDIEKMLANYDEAEIDFIAILNDQEEGTALESGSTPLIEVKTEPSFLGLMNDYEVVVHPINLALSVPNNYRDIKLTTYAHADQSITAGDPIIVEPRENEIIVSLHDGSEQRYIALNLDYSLLEGGALPISLKQVNNQTLVDEASLGIQYPDQFETIGFVIDGETYDSNSLTLNGYVSQSFTVAVIANYFGERVESEAVEIRLADAEEVLVDLSNDAALPDALAKIEAENADNIQPNQDTDQFDQWVQQFQETLIDAVNFRAPDLLAVYGDTSQWYQDTAQWIQNDIATTSIFYTDATYEITSIEESDDGNVAISTLERYYYTLDGIEAVRSLNKVYRLQSIGGQYIIASVDEQDTSN